MQSVFQQWEVALAPLALQCRILCLISCIAFHKPLSTTDDVAIREEERLQEAQREKVGLPRYLAIGAKSRVPSLLWLFFDSNGVVVPESSNLHPFGPNRHKYRTAEPDDDGEVEEGICPGSRFASCNFQCCLCRGAGVI